jgi:hypothetical protein
MLTAYWDQSIVEGYRRWRIYRVRLTVTLEDGRECEIFQSHWYEYHWLGIGATALHRQLEQAVGFARGNSS